MHACTYVSVCVRVCMHMCACVCMSMCVHVCTPVFPGDRIHRRKGRGCLGQGFGDHPGLQRAQTSSNESSALCRVRLGCTEGLTATFAGYPFLCLCVLFPRPGNPFSRLTHLGKVVSFLNPSPCPLADVTATLWGRAPDTVGKGHSRTRRGEVVALV